MMPTKEWTLVIGARDSKAKKQGKTPFSKIFTTGIGPRYAIYNDYISKLRLGFSTVVLLDRDKKKRAEGLLTKLERIEKAGNGVWQYNVHVKKWTEVPYKPESLNRCGVALIDC